MSLFSRILLVIALVGIGAVLGRFWRVIQHLRGPYFAGPMPPRPKSQEGKSPARQGRAPRHQ
jgi:hypothetical protein